MHFSNSPARSARPRWLLAWLVMIALLLEGCADSPTPSPASNNNGTAAASLPTSAISPAVTARAANPASNGQATPGQSALATAPATITKSSGEKINMPIELARTEQEQETGLMGRLSVPDETGMLFIFKQPGRVAFWMKDTPLALSIAFIAQDGKIVDIQDMESFSLVTHSPNQDYLYALEVAKGYFARKGVKPGDTFTFKS